MPSKTNTANLATEMARARTLAGEMGTITDHLNAALARVETALVAQKLGVPASVEIELDSESGHDYFKSLAFGKYGKKWQLSIDSGFAGDPHSWDSIPLLNASRELRMKAVDLLPELVKKLCEAVENELRVMQEKIGEANALADAIAQIEVTK